MNIKKIIYLILFIDFILFYLLIFLHPPAHDDNTAREA